LTDLLYQISEIQKSLRDSRTGVEKLIIKRTLHGKARTLTRERDAEGNEIATENLQNIDSSKYIITLLTFDLQRKQILLIRNGFRRQRHICWIIISWWLQPIMPMRKKKMKGNLKEK
jgi:hypothetical protein